MAAAMLLLAACATVPPPRQISAPEEAARFELSGRVNIRVEKEGFPGRVRWQHGAQRDELWFYSPLGNTVAHLLQDPSGAVLVTAEGKQYRAADLQGLAQDVLGWDLPLEALPYWVRGMPAPGTPPTEEQRDASGHLSSLQQDGWQVTYLDWKPAGVDGLPSKLDLQGERMRMRLVVDHWNLDAP